MTAVDSLSKIYQSTLMWSHCQELKTELLINTKQPQDPEAFLEEEDYSLERHHQLPLSSWSEPGDYYCYSGMLEELKEFRIEGDKFLPFHFKKMQKMKMHPRAVRDIQKWRIKMEVWLNTFNKILRCNHLPKQEQHSFLKNPMKKEKTGWATGLNLGNDSTKITYTSHCNIGIILFTLGTLQILLEHIPPWLWILGDHLEFSLGRLRRFRREMVRGDGEEKVEMEIDRRSF
ncbi:hypothetical protein Tco_0512261 [Tanacetum coccineum]